MCWAAPKDGLKSAGKWCIPVISFLETVRPSTHGVTNPALAFRFLFPHFAPDWTWDFERAGTNGAAQTVLTKLEDLCGFKGTKCTLHSPRARFATCATQLAFKREDRATLGRWSAGSVMPDRYDRGVCVTELRLRDEILGQVNDGWKPQKAFEVPRPPKKNTKTQPIDSETDTTSVTSTASQFKEEIDIADLGDFV